MKLSLKGIHLQMTHSLLNKVILKKMQLLHLQKYTKGKEFVSNSAPFGSSQKIQFFHLALALLFTTTDMLTRTFAGHYIWQALFYGSIYGIICFNAFFKLLVVSEHPQQ